MRRLIADLLLDPSLALAILIVALAWLDAILRESTR
jgi:hypothetical protein